MSGGSEAGNAWVTRVLGIQVSSHAMREKPDQYGITGIVAYRKALLGYRTAKAAVAARLVALQAAIPAALPHEAELAKIVGDELESLNDELGDAIDAAINIAQDDRAPYTTKTKALIASYLQLLAEDDLVRHVDANPFVPTRMASELSVALTNITRTMI